MKLRNSLLATLLSVQLSSAFAHGDEDHGAAPAPPSSDSQMPSAETHSPDFELFVQLQGDSLTVYLDRYADNQPVTGAQIEVDSEAFTATLQPLSAGIYRTSAAALNRPGEHSLLFTVVAGEQSDLLDTVLSVRPATDATHAAPSSRLWWWLGGPGLAALAAVILLLQRRRRPGSSSVEIPL
ncbi:MAG TPA: hypothetical protein VJA19_22660 [Pseudomonas sp.]|nr:hypothetical protein [Pseudomonas sp.]